MSDANFEMEEKRKRINNICKNVVQQFKEGDYQKAAKTLKNALERYPDNEKLQGLLSQFKLKVRDNKIKKLENEAIVLIQKGAGDEGQKKLREILKLDPSRTDLQHSLRNLRAESQEEYHSSMRKDSVRKICLYAALVILFVIVAFMSVAAWDNRKKLKDAKEYINSKQYKSAILELDKCGWFMAGEKSDLYNQILSIKETLKEEADDCGGKREYAKAIQLLQAASKASIYPDEFSEEIDLFRKLQKAELKAKSEAQQAKYDCESAARKARQCNPKIETSQLMSEAKTLSDEAATFLATDDFVQARQRWNQSARKYNEVTPISMKIDMEQKDALSAKEQCQSIHDIAQKVNAEIEATQVWEEATKTLVAANKQFEERQFIQARQNWLNAASRYTEALEISRRSPSYLKARQELEKWKSLKNAMTESSVLNLLGAPNYSLRESQRCILFYQDVPRVVRNHNGSTSIVNPNCGFIHLTNAGRDITLEYEKKKYDKAILVQNRRYEAERKRAGVNFESNDKKVKDLQRKLKSSHENKMKDIEQDYDTRRNNLIGGITPFKTIYFVSQWSVPDPDDAVASTLVSPQKQEEKTDVKWKMPSNWARLKINMEQRNVLTVLGSSDNANVIGKEVFEYGNIQGFGELEFTRRRDNQLRLTYWKEPLWTAVDEDLVTLGNSGDPNSL